MKKKSKRLAALLLSLLMVISLIPTTGLTVEAAAKPKLAKKSISIVIGGTSKIKVKNAPKGAKITYKSAKKNIAAISKQGKVKGIRSGTAKITVSVKESSKTTKLTYKVTVKKPKLSKGKLSLNLGKTAKLSVKNNPKKAKYTWKSSNPKVAAINKNGKVTAKSKGTATITAKVKTAKKTYSLICKVTVKSLPDSSDDVKKTYTVTFDSNGGSVVESQTVKENDSAKQPDDPTRSGYTFDGWYTEATSGQKFDFNTAITDNLTLYAHWSSSETPIPTPGSYTVTFDSNGGSAVAPQTVKENDFAKQPADPTRSGYTFDGWYTKADDKQKFDFNTAITADITLYAKWAVSEGEGNLDNNYNHNGTPSENEKQSYTVTFDSRGGTEIEPQTIEKSQLIVEPDTPEKSGYIFAGWFTKQSPENILKPFDFDTAVIDNDITLYAFWLDTEDSDIDGLINGLEAYYGTDLLNQDTDGDGLSDYIEVAILGTDPLVADPDMDSDEDGISNLEEIKIGTDPGDTDTDADGLNDKEEIERTTNPLVYDTDGDGVSDGKEIELGTDPLVTESSFTLDVAADTQDTVKPSLQIELAGEQVETLSIEPVNNDRLFPEDMPGYLGKAYDFSVDGTFGTALIQFDFDSSILETGAEPTIYYFNEETQTLEECTTTIDGNTASATVTHFSTYILIDRKTYTESFQWEDVWLTESEYNAVEIVLVIDDSSSMDWNDPNYERLNVARTLIDNLPTDSKIGLVRFDGWQTSALTPTLTTDKEAAKSFLTNQYFYSPGGTDMYNGVQKAFPLFESAEATTLKMMVVLSDGETDDTNLHGASIASANEAGIKIFTVGLGNSTSYFNDYLRPLANETGGTFYLAANAGNLIDIYKDINKKIDLVADSDGDGLPDYYEDNMFAFNGKKIESDKYNKDTDGDGLEDGEELTVEIVPSEDGKKAYVKGIIHSYPDEADSDNDGINDKKDPQPMTYTITDRTISMVEGLSYSNLSEYVGKTVDGAVKAGAAIHGISRENLKLLGNAVIVHANNSASGYWKDFWDSGLGSLALKFVRPGDATAIVYALRGTEFDKDFVNDTTADITLGVGWDTHQSKKAFSEYKKIASNKSFDYYVTGHSLGGRLALDVLYKIYNANKGGLFKQSANIPEPVHSATFNALGYNAIVYATLKNDVVKQYENKLSNFYYWQDLVGEGLGCSGVFKRTGTDIFLYCRDINGIYYRQDEMEAKFHIRDCDYHGIEYFQDDYDLLYTSPHSFSYWVY